MRLVLSRNMRGRRCRGRGNSAVEVEVEVEVVGQGGWAERGSIALRIRDEEDASHEGGAFGWLDGYIMLA